MAQRGRARQQIRGGGSPTSMSTTRLPVGPSSGARYGMQVRAVACAAKGRRRAVGPAAGQFMHLLVAYAEELHGLRELTERVIGFMWPRASIPARDDDRASACRVAGGGFAQYADFFSFGTNDLTQTALGFSRDDAEGKFLTGDIEQHVVEHNPFETLDQVGVGELIGFGVKRSRVSGVECPASASVCE